ncbi:MAG: MocR-like pyridoxine biosynthesis transcription factor PdxR [Telluria sp.]
MSLATLADFLLQRIDFSAALPMNRQLYKVLREAILDSLMPVGLQLPSSRELARELGVSRNTILHVYEGLVSEGFLEARTGAGTFVADTIPDRVAPAARDGLPAPRSSAVLSRSGTRLVAQAGSYGVQWGAFMPGVPDVTAFPNKVWSRLQNAHWRRSRPELLTYSSGAGLLSLRVAIAKHLQIARSVNCAPERIIITSGVHQSLDLVGKLLADPGDLAWVEDPCYWGTRSVLDALHMKIAPMPVDSQGMTLPARQRTRRPRFLVVSPSHQYPLGVVMSLARRRQLLEFAQANDSWIIEDDYDSEFRYASRPLPSLQGMDGFDRVLYMGSFSKTMFPGLRIGFLVVPAAMALPFATAAAELYRGGQTFTQAVLADFINNGHFAGHIRRMRQVYARRRTLLIDAIKANFGERLEIAGGEAGLHLTLLLPQHCDDQALAVAAANEGIAVRPLSRYYSAPRVARKGLLLGYACVDDALVAPQFAVLAKLIERYALS